VLVGLFLVRSLSVGDYAKFGLAYAFQVTTSTLMDLGYASTIIPLVGARVSDRSLVGRYVRAAKSHRDRAFWVLSPIAAIAFLLVTHRQGWSRPIQITLLCSVLLVLYSSGPFSIYSAPLILYRRLRAYYVPQTISVSCRLAVYALLRALGALNSWTAAGLGALNVTLDGFFLRRKARQSIDWPQADDPAVQKEVRQYILPAAPAIILGAFHGQIAVFLMSIFGSTVNLGEVAALSRLGQLFNIMMSFNFIVVEPYVARLRREQLLATYFRLTAIAAIGCTAVTLLAFAAPAIFLWPLGPHYRQLGNLIGWVVLTACINYIAGLVWIMNRSRKWLFWRGTFAEILLLAFVQIGFVAIHGVHSTRDAVMFNFASSFCYLAAHSYIATHGFRRGAADEALDTATPEITLP
jgi:O-antigen/teichoic acid export membrane protein